MNYASVITHSDGDLKVTAVVTAGVTGNAACAGDPAGWREENGNWEPVNPQSGTINTMLLISHDVTEGALARAVLTMCEAKSAALTRLAVSSLYSQELATGTGTDQFCVAAAVQGATPLTSASPHSILGQMIGTAVRDATLEALRWQNGLEPSYTRGIFHALSRYGLKEASIFEDLKPLLTERSLALLRQNSKAVFYEPMVGSAAYAIAAVLDRIRYETLPASIARGALRHQAACLAVALSAKPSAWPEFYTSLPEPDVEKPASLVLAAIARGWESKWI
jgi:adenosylcobinamide amidohydrolase